MFIVLITGIVVIITGTITYAAVVVVITLTMEIEATRQTGCGIARESKVLVASRTVRILRGWHCFQCETWRWWVATIETRYGHNWG